MGGNNSKGSSSSKSHSATTTITEQDRAVLDLKNARDRLKKYQARLSKDEKRLRERAICLCRDGDKRRAAMIMKVRKKKMKEVDGIEDQLLNIQEVVSSIRWQEEQAKVLSSLKEGKDALKRMHEDMSVDDVLDLMEDIEEEQEVERRIGEILTNGTELELGDEEEVEAELKAMEKEIIDNDAGRLPDFPVAPQGDLADFPVAPQGGLDKVDDKEGEEVVEGGGSKVAVPG